MAISRPFIDDDGDMYLHPRGGGIAVFLFQLENGNPRDMTGAQILFIVEDFEVQLTAGDTTDALVLTIEPGDLDFMIGKKKSFILLDETPTPPQVLMEGTIIVASMT